MTQSDIFYSYGGHYANLAASALNGTARMDADVMREVEPCLHLSCEVSAEGVLITLSGEGDLALALPVFEFDGERTTTIRVAEKVVDVSLDGWICRYETNGAIIDTGLVYGNRNGHYRRFEARRKGPLAVKVTLIRASFPLSLPTSDVTDWPQGIFHGAAPRSFLHFAYLRQAEEGAAATGQIQPPVL